MLSALRTLFLSRSSHALCIICSHQGLVEGLVDVEVLPLFGGSLAGALETTFLALVSQLFKGDFGLLVVNEFSHVALCKNEHDRLCGLDFLDFVAPLVNIGKA